MACDVAGAHRQRDRRSPAAGSRAGARTALPTAPAALDRRLGIGQGRPPAAVHTGDCHAAGQRHRSVDREKAPAGCSPPGCPPAPTATPTSTSASSTDCTQALRRGFLDAVFPAVFLAGRLAGRLPGRGLARRLLRGGGLLRRLRGHVVHRGIASLTLVPQDVDRVGGEGGWVARTSSGHIIECRTITSSRMRSQPQPLPAVPGELGHGRPCRWAPAPGAGLAKVAMRMAARPSATDRVVQVRRLRACIRCGAGEAARRTRSPRSRSGGRDCGRTRLRHRSRG
ncbi:DUF6233 domain-containing protein [Streptomyces griseiscabiei]|uniref:DUF6233 domain-containing protein n=1 Tax=Streptomyces griseiscabiei TaxID=2993540 RepID=UPI0037DA4F63